MNSTEGLHAVPDAEDENEVAAPAAPKVIDEVPFKGLTLKQINDVFPPHTGKGITPAAAVKKLTGLDKPVNVKAPALKVWLDKAAEKGILDGTGGKYRLAPAKEKAKKEKAVSPTGITRSPSEAPKEGTQKDVVDGKVYPLTKFPTYYATDDKGNRVTLRKPYTRANREAYKEMQAKAKAAEKAKADAAKAKAKK